MPYEASLYLLEPTLSSTRLKSVTSEHAFELAELMRHHIVKLRLNWLDLWQQLSQRPLNVIITALLNGLLPPIPQNLVDRHASNLRLSAKQWLSNWNAACTSIDRAKENNLSWLWISWCEQLIERISFREIDDFILNHVWLFLWRTFCDCGLDGAAGELAFVQVVVEFWVDGFAHDHHFVVACLRVIQLKFAAGLPPPRLRIHQWVRHYWAPLHLSF